jgi:hypothetical protein
MAVEWSFGPVCCGCYGSILTQPYNTVIMLATGVFAQGQTSYYLGVKWSQGPDPLKGDGLVMGR